MKTSTLEIPKQMFRYGAAAADPDKHLVRMSISSDAPYKRYDYRTDKEYWEILDHGPNGIDMTRLEAGTSLLFNHDSDIIIGRNMSHDCDGHKLYVDSKISLAPDVESYRIKIEEGILKACSVGYEILDEGRKIGEKDGLPLIKFRWAPYEASLVSIEADISVGIGRTRNHPPASELKEIEIIDTTPKINLDDARNNEKSLTTEKDMKLKPLKFLEADNGGNATTGTAVETERERKQRERDEQDAKRDREQNIQDGIKAAREREKEIRDIAKRATVPEDKKNEFERALDNAIEKSVTDEKAVPDFQTYVFKNFWGKAKVLDTPSGHGSGDIQVIGERGERPGRSIGAEFIKSKEFIACGGHVPRGATIGVEIPGLSILGARGKAALAQRAGFTSSDLSAVNVQIQTGVIGLGVQRMTIMDLVAPGSTSAASIIYPRENSFGTLDGVAFSTSAGVMPKAGMVGERGLKPKWDPDLTTETATVKKVAVTTDVPDEFLADFPAARSYIDERLPYMVDTRTEEQMLYGDGTGNNLKGIFTNAGVQTRAITTTDDSTKAASLRQGLTDISVGSMFEPDGYAFHPYDWETAQLLKDDNKRFLAGGPYYVPLTNGVFVELHTFWGKPVVVTTAVNYGRPLAGAWKLGAQYFLREGMRIEMTNSNKDNFERNMITVRAEHRLALATYRPPAFIEFTGFPARA